MPKRSLLTCLFLWAATLAPVTASTVVLHNFTGGSEGYEPDAPLLYDGASLYGTTMSGGPGGGGVIFRLAADGSGFTPLHALTFAEGTQPGSLSLAGGTLYGVAGTGGPGNEGTLFSMDVSGSGFRVLHSFANDGGGAIPVTAPVAVGSVLYGLTATGGNPNLGVLYRVNTDGTGFTVLHNFGGADGDTPRGSLTIFGDMVYGSVSGSAGGHGGIFAMKLDGTGFSIIHSFSGGAADGGAPWGTLLQVGAQFYGTVTAGGAFGHGGIFRMNLDGSGVTLLHSFLGGGDGSAPGGGLTLSGTTLFGTTPYGSGAYGQGALFSMELDGSNFGAFSFAGGTSEGSWPTSDLTIVGDKVYGTTERGGSQDWGTVYAMPMLAVPEPAASGLMLAAAGILIVPRRREGSTASRGRRAPCSEL